MADLIGLSEYAKLQGVDPATVRQKISRGNLKAQKIAGVWLIDKEEPYIDFRRSGGNDMLEFNLEPINKEVVEEVKRNCKFVDEVDLGKYELITLRNGILTISKSERIEKEIFKGKEVIDVEVTGKIIERVFKKDSISGIYVEY